MAAKKKTTTAAPAAAKPSPVKTIDTAMVHTPPAAPPDDNWVPTVSGLGAVGRYGFVYFHGGSRETFELPVPPQEITVEEPAATSITPTLGAGKWVERRGNIFKQISIAGTFGFALPGALTPPRADAAVGIKMHIAPEKSAFARTHGLRKFFRDYQEVFRTGGSDHERTFMVWINPRDGEQLVVEPLSFRLIRPRAFVYRYQIELRVLGVYSGQVSTTVAATDNSSAASRLELKDIAISDALTAADTTELRKYPLPASSTGFLDAIDEFMERVRKGQQTGPSSYIGIGLAEVDRFYATCVNSFQTAVGLVNDGFGAAGSVLSVIETGLSAVRGAYSVHLSEQESLKQIMARTLALGVLGQDALRVLQGDTSPQALSAADADTTTGGGVSEGAISAALEGLTGFREERPFPGETGEQFSARVAGSALAWPFIVTLNHLRPPYFSTTDETLPGTVPLGGSVVVPTFGGTAAASDVAQPSVVPTYTQKLFVESYSSTGEVTFLGINDWRLNRWSGYVLVAPGGETRVIAFSGASSVTLADPFSVQLQVGDAVYLRSAALSQTARGTTLPVSSRVFGKDVLLTATSQGFDMALSRTGDVATVEGPANLEQAVQIKLRSRYGDLPLHTSGVSSFGIDLVVGSKMSPDALFALESSIRFLLLSDPRIAAVRRVAVSGAGTALSVHLDIVPKDGNLFRTLTQTLV